MSYHDPDFEIDLGADNAHTRVIRLVGSGKRVLELGCSSGYMSRVLIERFGCRVTGVERSEAAAARARDVCERVIVADLETLDLAAELGEERFDVLVCADVLEHLRDPAAILSALRPRLGEDGYLVCSIPNISHAAVVAELIQGRFNYRPEGLLDETHVRFYTLETIHDFLERAGYAVEELERLRVEPEDTEFRTELAALGPEVAALLRSHPESTTYQFVLRARPVPASAAEPAAPASGVFERLRLRIAAPHAGGPGETKRMIEALLSRVRFLEEKRLELTREAGKLREDGVQGNIRARLLEQELAARGQTIERQREELDRLQSRLASVESSILWRILRRLRRGRR